MHEKEQLIKEHRLIEATKKNYTSMEGKFGLILKFLGEPILSQSSSAYSSTPWIDVYEVPGDEGMPVADEDEMIVEIGKIFSALKYGVNLEIKYLKEDKKLEVLYNNRVVYREMDHDLDCFVPLKEWEDAIDRIYVLVEKKMETRAEKNKRRMEEDKVEKMGFLNRLREKWGI